MYGHGRPKNLDRSSFQFVIACICSQAKVEKSRVAYWVALSLCFCNGVSISAQSTQNVEPFASSTPAGPLRPYAPADFSARTSVEFSKYAFRLTWGGGQSRTWHASIAVENGSVELVQPLGLDPFVPGTAFQDGKLLRIESSNASTFGGIDFQTTASLDASLTIDFFCDESPEVRFHRVITLRELTEQILATSLDDNENRISLQRKPGDELHIETKHRCLVFNPMETFKFTCSPRVDTSQLGLSPKLKMQLQTARTGRAVWNSELTFQTNSKGKLQLDPVEVPLPKEPGVYDLQLTLSNRSLRNWNGPEFRREVQLIVVDTNSATQIESTLWSEIAKFNVVDTLKTNDWRQRFTELSSFSPLSSGRTQIASALGNDKRSVVEYDQNQFVSLSPGGWLAIPLSTTSTGEPHIVEIEYLNEGPMRLGVSVLQPDSTNQIGHFGTDSGIVVPNSVELPDALQEHGVRKHRIVFWPRHRSPLLLFANRDDNNRAVIGNVRLLAGPRQLAASTLDNRATDDRKYLAYLEKPLFSQQFDATKWLEQNSGQLLDDWQTFSDGASRLVQHLKANGYTGMALTVSCDGSALYPSTLTQPTPRYDNGVFWPTGKDLLRKDVLELLFRICDREQLELLPVLEFSTPLPELEQIRNRNFQDAEGIDLVDQQGARIETNSSGRMIAYNPLDRRVQTATLNVVNELAERYADHASFNGVGIKLSPEGLLPLPSPRRGMDNLTVQQFAAEQHLSLTIDETNTLPDVRRRILTEFPNEWVQWRANKVAAFLNEIQRSVAVRKNNAKLILLPVDLYESEDSRSSLNPSPRNLPEFEAAFLRMGLDLKSIGQNPGIDFLQTHRLAFDNELADNRFNIHVNHNERPIASFETMTGGQLFVHRHRWTHFAQLQQSAPFGHQQADLYRIQPLSPSDSWNRQRFAESLFKYDSKIILDGGWLLPTGQNSAIGSTVDAFTRLPSKDFQSVSSIDNQTINESIAVRQLNTAEGTYFYVANPNPWPMGCQLLCNQREAELNLLATRNDDLLIDGKSLINIELAPFEVVAARVQDPAFQLLGYATSVDDRVMEALRRQLDRLQAKVSRAGQAVPWPVLQDESFEATSDDSDDKPWPIDPRNRNLVEVINSGDAKTGQNVLSLRCVDKPTFIRSHIIPTPSTGRLSITVWVRTMDNNPAPPLNVSIDAYHRGLPFYRYASVGKLQKSENDPGNWRQVAVHFDDVPTSELSELRIGFDMMGPGHAQIDQVQVFDRWFDEQDAAALTQQFALANYRLKNENDLNGCREFLQQYWPLFFNEYFPDKPSAIPAIEVPKQAKLNEDGSSESILEQIKNAPQRLYQKR